MNIIMIIVLVLCGLYTVLITNWCESRVNHWRAEAEFNERRLETARNAIDALSEARNRLLIANAAMKKHLSKLKQLRRQPAVPRNSGQAEKETT